MKNKIATNITEQVQKTTLYLLIQRMLQILFVFCWLIQFLAFFVLVLNYHKFIFVTPFVTFGSKFSVFVVLIVYICIVFFNLYTFIQTLHRTTNNVLQNIILFTNNIIFLTSIRLFYQVLTAKANDYGILIQNRFYTIYYNFSLEEKLDWYPRFVKEMNMNLNEINLSILAEAKDYSQFKHLLLQHVAHLKTQSEFDLITMNKINSIYNLLSVTLDKSSLLCLLLGSLVIICSVGVLRPPLDETIKLLKEILKKLGE